MAHALSITDGTNTVTLTSGDYTLTDYVPVVADAATAADDIVSDTISVVVSDTTTALVQSNINDIEELLTYAARRQEMGTGPRVYLKFQVSGDSDTYRSEIVNGNVSVTQDAMRSWVGRKAYVTIQVRRRGFWEDDSETTLATTQALTNDGQNNSHVVTGVNGVLPSPAKITLANNAGSSLYWSRFHLSNNAFNDPSNFSGYYDGGAISWTGAQTAYVADSWTLSAGFLDDCAGDYFRLLAAFTTGVNDVPAGTYWSAKLYYNVTELASTDMVYAGVGVTRGLYDIGAMPLPPGGYYTSNAALTLKLLVRASTTGQCTLDFLQIIPAGPGVHRKWRQIGYLAANGESIVDDPYEGITYLLSSGDRVPIITTRGEPLMLWPGKSNRITVLFEESDIASKFQPTRSTQLTVSHRPRRLSV